MRQKNRVAPLCLALALVVLPLTPHAMAAQSAPAPAAMERIAPRFDHISRISCGMTISAAGYASATGSYTMYDGMDGTITLTLYRLHQQPLGILSGGRQGLYRGRDKDVYHRLGRTQRIPLPCYGQG